MTDAEFKVLEELLAWHLGTCQTFDLMREKYYSSLGFDWRKPGHAGALGYGAVQRALALLKSERGDRPLTASLSSLVEDT